MPNAEQIVMFSVLMLTYSNNNNNGILVESTNLLSTVSRSNWNLEMLVFVEGGIKTGVPGGKPSKQGREPTTNSGNRTRATLVGGERS